MVGIFFSSLRSLGFLRPHQIDCAFFGGCSWVLLLVLRAQGLLRLVFRSVALWVAGSQSWAVAWVLVVPWVLLRAHLGSQSLRPLILESALLQSFSLKCR